MWGLDDYQFLPFFWGSSQLVGHAAVRPPSIHHDDALALYGDDYLYLSAVRFVKDVRRPPPPPLLCPHIPLNWCLPHDIQAI